MNSSLTISWVLAVCLFPFAVSAGFWRVNLESAPLKSLAKPVVYKGQKLGPTSRTWKTSAFMIMGGGYGCTGVVIHERAILTAGHCFEKPERRNLPLEIDFQDDTGFVSMVTYSADQFKTHLLTPAPQTGHLDLAIIVFDASILPDERFVVSPIVTSADIKNFSDLRGRKLYAAGAGRNEGTLYEDERRDPTEVGKLYFTGVEYEGVSWDSLSVYSKGDSKICMGDSGGGLFLQQGGQLILVGILSGLFTDDQLGLCGRNALYAPLNKENAEWIDRIIGQL